MLTTDTISAFVANADTRTLCDVLTEHSLIGTDVGDRVLASARNDSARFAAIQAMLTERGAWETAA